MLLVYFGILVLFILQPYTKQRYTNIKSFCLIAFIYLVAIYALRDLNYGDLIGYKNTYLKLPSESYLSIISDWLSGESKDGGFYIFAKIFADIGISAELWMHFIGALFAGAFCCFTYKKSKEPFLSIIILLVFYLSFTFTGLRQTMAMALIYIAYILMSEKKLAKFLICVLLASAFHSSALIFIPAYWIYKMKVGWKNIFIPVIFLGIALIAPDLFRNAIEFLAWNESLEGYADAEQTLSWAGYIIQLFIYAFCFIFRKSTRIEDENEAVYIDGFFNCMMIGLCFQSFAVTVAEAFRMSYYFSMCSVCAVPNIIFYQKKKKDKKFLYYLVLVCLLAYMMWSRMYFGYTYFWE